MKQLMTALGVAILGAVLVTPAAAAPGDLKAKITFQFKASGKMLDQGEYRFRRPNAANIVRIENKTNRSAIMVKTNVLTETSSGPSKLVFRVYGDKYFLGQIHNSGAKTLDVPLSSEEKEMKGSAPKMVDVMLSPDADK